jgi:hypothetical protein
VPLASRIKASCINKPNIDMPCLSIEIKKSIEFNDRSAVTEDMDAVTGIRRAAVALS